MKKVMVEISRQKKQTMRLMVLDLNMRLMEKKVIIMAILIMV